MFMYCCWCLADHFMEFKAAPPEIFTNNDQTLFASNVSPNQIFSLAYSKTYGHTQNLEQIAKNLLFPFFFQMELSGPPLYYSIN